jgi:hypothetical protein
MVLESAVAGFEYHLRLLAKRSDTPTRLHHWQDVFPIDHVNEHSFTQFFFSGTNQSTYVLRGIPRRWPNLQPLPEQEKRERRDEIALHQVPGVSTIGGIASHAN